MARVNVETRALAESRFFHLMDDLKMNRFETIGLLVVFWHDSQERLVWQASKEEVLKFIPCRDESQEKIFNALVKNDYISVSANKRIYVIRGNRKHVLGFKQRKQAASRGGKKKGVPEEAYGSKPKRQACASKILAPADPRSDQINAMQINAIKDHKPKETASPPAPPATGSAPAPRKAQTPLPPDLPDLEAKLPVFEPPPEATLPEWDLGPPSIPGSRDGKPGRVTLHQVGDPPRKERKKLTESQLLAIKTDEALAVYVAGWQARYDTQEVPDIGGKSRGILRRMISDHGAERVKDLLQVYCQHREPWFEKLGHTLVAFERAYNQLAVALAKGDDSNFKWDRIFTTDTKQARLGNAKTSLPRTN